MASARRIAYSLVVLLFASIPMDAAAQDDDPASQPASQPVSQPAGEPDSGPRIWLYKKDGQQHGPVSAIRLRALFKSKALGGNPQVRMRGARSWSYLGDEPKFSSLVRWYLVRGGKKYGPHDSKTIRHLIRTGQLAGDAKIWRPGHDRWWQVRLVPELASSLPQNAAPGRRPQVALVDREQAPRYKESSGFTLMGGAAYSSIASATESQKPGTYLDSGPLFMFFIGYQKLSYVNGLSMDMMYRIGLGYSGALLGRSKEDGSAWVSRISLQVDLLFPVSMMRLGMRSGVGVGLADMGQAYRSKTGDNRDVLGLYIELGGLVEWAVTNRFTLGLEGAMTGDGLTSLDQNTSREQTSYASIGGLLGLYAGYTF